MSKPLTIDELKALPVGDWVYVMTADGKYGAYGRVCEKFDDDNFRVETIESYLVDPYSDYGTKWLAYKNKEQAETKGEIVELPCKIGDTVYYVEYFCNYKGCSHDTQSYCCGCQEMIERERKNEKYVIAEKKFALTDFSQIGKKYFTDKSDAERRLAELRGEK